MPVFPGKNPVARARSDGQPEPEKEARGSANARGAIGAYPRPRRDFCRPRAGAALFDRRLGGRRTLAEQFGLMRSLSPALARLVGGACQTRRVPKLQPE
jgi:hypothetical protein